ncbi:sigma-54 interaction domain-containing protein [Marinospirillum insulare]|uniref:sigma-54 interaction domain-containing protein n=1 Tax=Marinospirillum insulare TaxID=217169 RepID=UPI00055A2289|nr:sigma 54-interacting transcriptional regulator [Marinospirillum insulare]
MTKVLVSWIGANDIRSTTGEQVGPILSTLRNVPFDSVELLYSYPQEEVKAYLDWLRDQVSIPIHPSKVSLSSPVDFGQIYLAANEHLARITAQNIDLSVLLSPGTPAMQAVWILLGKTRYPCRFYQSSLEKGVEQATIPFDLSAEYIPAAQRLKSSKIHQLSSVTAPVDAAFDHIVTRNPRMQALKSQAQILAEREVPVLIYGETGTGKELFARAIHNASERSSKPFIAVNCGAIPLDLVDSVLFGHKKGAFTGAIANKPGVFQEADGGTLFLDEFGELDHSVQVRLLRVLQEGRFTPVGAHKEEIVDVRLITATHRNLMKSVAEGSFREDLFYRIAIGVLHLPPIRAREGDLLYLADRLLTELGKQDSTLSNKKLSPDAKNIILNHAWRGNVRELQSTLLRSALWCGTDNITAEDMHQAIFQMPEQGSDILSRDLSQGIDIQNIIGELTSNYIRRALELSGHNKTRAAELLGLKNYQTLSNWMEKYDIS